MNLELSMPKVLQYISTNIDDERLHLENISRVVNISKYHFHRSFSNYVGMPLNKYIRSLKLKRACLQLNLTNQPIVDIAINAGFHTHESFTRAFKQNYLVTPSDFRSLKMTNKESLISPYQHNPVLFDVHFEIKKRNKQHTLSLGHQHNYEDVMFNYLKFIDRVKALGFTPNKNKIFFSSNPNIQHYNFECHFVSDDYNNIQSSLLVKNEIPQGKYASLTFNGGRTRNDIEKAIQILHKILRNKNIPIPKNSEYLFYFYNSSIYNVEPLLKTEVSILIEI
ncbi:helix-turn-helix domain-containing protein [Paraphotobacterium marinum]|nr:helix-turn-helix domain-containing protein [Paraphotobacterium marinum]